MSSFAKRGERQAVVAQKKKIKKHTKAFYRIIGEMDNIARQLDPTLDYTEDNINEYVLPIYGRELDNMEKFVVLSKIQNAKEHIAPKYVMGIDPYETEDNT